MQKLGKRQLTLALAGADGRRCRRSCRRLAAGDQGPRQRARVHVRRHRGQRRHPLAAAQADRPRASGSRTSARTRARSRTSSSAWSATGGDGRRDAADDRLQPLRGLGHLPLRDGALHAHAAAERGDAGDHHVAVLRRVRVGDRVAHVVRRRRPLRRVHRAGADHAVAVHGQHLERVVRHLLPQVHRHDLRAAVGADLVRRDDHRLRRARRRPSRSSSGSSSWPPRRSSCPVRIDHPLG